MASRLRAVVLEALHHYGCPLGHGELAAYAAAVHGVPVAEGDLPALVDAERHAHAAGERRDVWVCPTMLADPFLDEDLRHSKADYLARQFRRPEARLFGDVRVPAPNRAPLPIGKQRPDQVVSLPVVDTGQAGSKMASCREA